MQKTCEHLGVEHPRHFQCANCDDTADKCNCDLCGMVFCEKCQDMLFIDCVDVVDAWMKTHHGLDVSIMCEHKWVETTPYWFVDGRMIARGSGKVFARCLMCGEKMPSIEWYEFPQEARSSEGKTNEAS